MRLLAAEAAHVLSDRSQELCRDQSSEANQASQVWTGGECEAQTRLPEAILLEPVLATELNENKQLLKHLLHSLSS